MSDGVAETSLEALRKKQQNGTDITDKKKCKAIIQKFGPITMKEMEIHMGKNKHSFSGRINKLKEEGEIEKVGVKDGHQLLDEVEDPLFIPEDQEQEENEEDEPLWEA